MLLFWDRMTLRRGRRLGWRSIGSSPAQVPFGQKGTTREVTWITYCEVAIWNRRTAKSSPSGDVVELSNDGGCACNSQPLISSKSAGRLTPLDRSRWALPISHGNTRQYSSAAS